MQEFSKDNNATKFLLVLLTRETGQDVANACQRILKERRPSKTWVDRGREFYNKDVQILVDLHSTENEENCSVIERFNRTIKEKMFKYFSGNNTKNYVDVLYLLVDQYNNTIHSSIKMTPNEASRKENENKVWRILYPEFGGKILGPKFSVGDNVRIKKKKNLFDKGYTQRFMNKNFK